MKYTAIIVEPREHEALPFVLNNFLENLSEEWSIIIYHGNLNIDYLRNIIHTDLSQYEDRLSFVHMQVDNLSRDEYSNMLVYSKEFYSHIPTETFLIFQTDSMIFKKNKDLINEFLEYDYVGAPWGWYVNANGNNVGNGGLSLRKKSKMLEIMDTERHVNNDAEDVYFSSSPKLYKPSFEKAKRFSVEHIFSEVTFGCHQPWIRRNELLAAYPEVETLMRLNGH